MWVVGEVEVVLVLGDGDVGVVFGYLDGYGVGVGLVDIVGV